MEKSDWNRRIDNRKSGLQKKRGKGKVLASLSSGNIYFSMFHCGYNYVLNISVINNFNKVHEQRSFFHIQGRWKNIRQVLTVSCMRCGDGIDWQLREGAQKYDLTVRSKTFRSKHIHMLLLVI